MSVYVLICFPLYVRVCGFRCGRRVWLAPSSLLFFVFFSIVLGSHLQRILSGICDLTGCVCVCVYTRVFLFCVCDDP